MTPSQRQNHFDRYFSALARGYSRALGLEHVGTIRKLPPPPFPGEVQGPTRVFINALSAGGGAARLVEFNGRMYGALRKATEWAESGKGPKPSLEAVKAPKAAGAGARAVRRKV